ncbi:hypothetical protein FGG08_005572 [Glutinoglossum americanum]|uniref:AIG1-type G domain-containing protein n=1 Tax=Glutinoglossum americanum TaxID=1670608 RepID=A0A9P8KYD8_9PEZI|nr:hypothetical protein FGG08_005572 [Glutinoglossum americanum]
MPYEEEPPEKMILAMGVTGAGKSYFVNSLTDGLEVTVGSSLQSCTQSCQMVKTRVGNTDVTVVDCPGFDDTTRSDADILEEIANLLSLQYILGVKLIGVLYLHRITDNRMQGSARKNLEMFTKLVGDAALPNVVLVTTMWGLMNDKYEANQRYDELREEYWCDMIDKGSLTTRFDGSRASAEGILAQLLGKKDVVLRVQKELVDQDMKLNETSAGAYLNPRVEEEEREFNEREQELLVKLRGETSSSKKLKYQLQREEAESGREQRKRDKETLKTRPGRKMKDKLKNWDSWKGGAKTIAMIIGVVVVNVALPLAGVLV